uniref:Uncharacterized protein n=1 Tax=Romanomermis culicivorax TaxID=13658 RepID=A0A915JQF4_ROMCU
MISTPWVSIFLILVPLSFAAGRALDVVEEATARKQMREAIINNATKDSIICEYYTRFEEKQVPVPLILLVSIT